MGMGQQQRQQQQRDAPMAPLLQDPSLMTAPLPPDDHNSAPLYQNQMQLAAAASASNNPLPPPPHCVVVDTPPHSGSGASTATGGSALLTSYGLGGADVISYSTNSESQSYQGSSSAAESPMMVNYPPPQKPHSWGRSNGGPPPVPPIKPALKDTSSVIYQNFSLPPGQQQHHLQRPIPIAPSPGVAQQQRGFNPASFNQQHGAPPLLPKLHHPPPYRPPPPTATAASSLRPQPHPHHLGGLVPPLDLPLQGQHPPLLGFGKTTSDGGGSHDSHNDSGYCPRVGGGSGGPSPSLSGMYVWVYTSSNGGTGYKVMIVESFYYSGGEGYLQ